MNEREYTPDFYGECERILDEAFDKIRAKVLLEMQSGTIQHQADENEVCNAVFGDELDTILEEKLAERLAELKAECEQLVPYYDEEEIGMSPAELSAKHDREQAEFRDYTRRKAEQ